MSVCRKCNTELPEGAVYCFKCGIKQALPKRTPKRRGNGQGSAYKRGRTWEAQRIITTNGKRVKITKAGFATKKEALEYIPFLVKSKTPQNTITLAELFDRWQPYYEPRIGKTTMQGHQAAYKWIKPLHTIPFVELCTDDWQSCVDTCGKGKRTKENIKSLGMALYKYAATLKIIDHNYAQYIWCGNDEKGKRECLSFEELEKVRQAVGVVDYADYVYCLCYLGFRPTEFLSLKITDYDENNNCFVGGIKTEAGRNRTVTVSPKILPVVKRLISKADEYVFCDLKTGKQLTESQFRDRAFAPLMKTLGIENRTPYSCRHTFSNLLKNVPGSDTDKAALMGHSDVSMTKYYQSPDYESLKHITDNL